MRRAEEKAERVRHDESDEADESGDGHGRTREKRGGREHGAGGAIEVDAQRRGGLLAERVGVDAWRQKQRESDAGADDDCRHGELVPADHRHAALEPAEHGPQAQREPIARGEDERDDRAGERGEHHAGEQHGEHGRATAETREAPDKGDGEHRADE